MEKSKLIQILKAFSANEWNDFEKFVESPYFNKGRNYIVLLKELKQFYPEFNSNNLNSLYLYSRIFEGKTHNRNVIKVMFTGLYKLAVEFLIQQEVKENKFRKELYLLHQLSSRNIDSIHDSLFSSIENTLLNNKAGLDIFETLAQLQAHKVQHSYKGNFLKTVKESIPTRADYHMFSFMILLLNEVRDQIVLKDSYNITTSKDLSGQIFNKLDLKKLINYTEKHYPHLSRILNTIITCYAASVTTDDVYHKAKELMMENFGLFEKSLQLQIICIMEGASSIRLRSGKREFIREWHEIHRFSLENFSHLYEDLKYIHPSFADNMINMAFWNKEYAWIVSFLNNHKYEFPEEFKKYLIGIGNAYIFYSRKEYREALKILSGINDKLFSFRQKVNNLQLYIYYELNEFELAINKLDSFRHFINSNKNFDELAKNKSIIFVNMYEQLLKYKLGNKEIDLKQLRSIILREDPAQGLDWLLEKIEEIERQ